MIDEVREWLYEYGRDCPNDRTSTSGYNQTQVETRIDCWHACTLRHWMALRNAEKQMKIGWIGFSVSTVGRDIGRICTSSVFPDFSFWRYLVTFWPVAGQKSSRATSVRAGPIVRLVEQIYFVTGGHESLTSPRVSGGIIYYAYIYILLDYPKLHTLTRISTSTHLLQPQETQPSVGCIRWSHKPWICTQNARTVRLTANVAKPSTRLVYLPTIPPIDHLNL